jgi:hypothetical protein
MKNFTPSAGTAAISNAVTEPVNARIFRTMTIVVFAASVLSLFFFPWRVATGLLLGGLLSLLNFRWMHSSIASVLSVASSGIKPEIRITQYVVRYFVVGLAVYLAYSLHFVSLPATLAGLCSFVVALFVEAFREFYFSIVRREEIG